MYLLSRLPLVNRAASFKARREIWTFLHTNHVVLKVQFDARAGTSNVTIVAGTGSPGTSADNTLATQSALYSPTFVSLIEDDSTGEVAALENKVIGACLGRSTMMPMNAAGEWLIADLNRSKLT